VTKRRIIYVVLIGVTIFLGLFTRRNAAQLPPLIGDYAPDALWAVMMYWIAATCAPRWTPLRTAIVAVVICYLDEISQLYHAPWIDAIRATRLGGLVLGFVFVWSDIVCYTVGVACAMSLDWLLLRRRN
jgi:hypothetical protein